jgi:putative Holliday junction resolvase
VTQPGQIPQPPGDPGGTPEAGVVAGIDFGTVRIGVAVSDARRRIATPQASYRRRTPRADAEWFRRFAAEYRVTRFVVGLPVHLDGGESRISRMARQFGQWLHDATGLPVDYFDERFTTHEAETVLLEAGMTSKRRKARRDMLAAQMLLQAYLDRQCRGESQPPPLDA